MNSSDRLRHDTTRWLSWWQAATVAVLLFWSTAGVAQPPDPAPTPVLRHDPGGPDSFVKALQFAPDGKTLYVAGWNKVVQVYKAGDLPEFHYEPRLNYRVPVGPGRFGMIEAMALSDDGRYLAVAGPGWAKSMDALMKVGYVWPRGAADEAIWNDVGTIYVYDTNSRECRVLRGHRGDIRQLEFPAGGGEQNQAPRLVSVGFEYEGETINQSVRAWSIDDGTPIGQPLMLPNSNLPPRIRAWSDQQNSLHVAVSISQITSSGATSELKLWSPSRNAVATSLPVSPGVFAIELSGSGGSRRLFAGHTGGASAYNVSDTGRNARQAISGLSAGATPFAAAEIPSANSNTASRVAFISIQGTDGGDLEYWLNIADGGRSRPVGRLWTNTKERGETSTRLREPALVVSADGQLLAAAGFQGNDVRVYKLADLPSAGVRGEIAPSQILASENAVPSHAAFARRDNATGIAIGFGNASQTAPVLSNGRPFPSGTLILDPGTGTLADNATGWTPDVASPGRLTGRLSTDRSTVIVSGASASLALTIQVPQAFRPPDVLAEVTAYVLCPAVGKNPPLAIVATHIQGEPFLNVFRADTGDFLRELTGHVRRISNLSLSADGNLLLSSSLDGTVRGWLLEDLVDTTIGHVGLLNGLQVAARDGRLIAEKVQPNTPAATSGIRENDVIAGLVHDGEVVTFENPSQFYLHMSRTPPGPQATVVVRLTRGGRNTDVTVPVGQGADIREPLFSILVQNVPGQNVAGANANAAWNWLVWSPLGQFDLSGPELEQRLGWHLNTGDDGAPVTYSSIDQYRDRFWHEGLLGRLLTGDHLALRPAAPPPILVSLLSDDGQVATPDYDNDLVVRQAGGSLLLEFPDDAGRMVRSAEWQISDGEGGNFAPVRGDLWEARLNAAQVNRGQRFLNIRLLTADQPPREVSRRFGLRYQPAAPELKLVSPDNNIGTVADAVLPLHATAAFATPGRVVLTHGFDDNQSVETTTDFETSGDLRQDITLRPGRNTLRLVARNNDIPDDVADFAFLEESSLEITVTYTPVEAPVITVESVEVTETGQAADLNDGSLTVDRSNITIRGTIAGDRPLTEASFRFNDQESAFAGFTAGSAQQFPFSRQLQLQPGRQRLTISASAGGESGTLDLDLNFHPALPAVTVLSPERQRTLLDASRDEHSVALHARVEQLGGDYPFEFDVAVDGQTIDRSLLSFDAASGTLSGTLPLVPDANQQSDEHRIEVRLANEWRRESVHPLAVEFRHPPRLADVTVNRPGDSAIADILCQVETSPSRPVTSVEVTVNGSPVPVDRFSVDGDDPSQHQMRIPDVPLREGPNEISIVAHNRDGRSNAADAREVVPPPPKPAVIRLPNPVGQVSSAELPIAFSVESESPLQRVDVVVRQDRGPELRTSLLANAADRPGSVQTFRHELNLNPGTSVVRIEVQNRGGLSESSFAVSYVPPPVSVHLTSLEPLNQQSPAALPKLTDGRLVFDQPAGFSRATLHGFVSWSPGIRPTADTWTVRVWINGFLRSTSAVVNETKRRTEFQMPVVLNQRSNRIRIEAAVNDLNQPLSDENLALLEDIPVRCTNPETRQRLHLVLMGLQM
ncbi:MAG: hypothetical protein R3C19_11435 [Planctomycetaceae bacterium]